MPFHDAPGGGERHGERVLCHRFGAVVGHVHDPLAGRPCRIEIDVVDTYSGPHDRRTPDIGDDGGGELRKRSRKGDIGVADEGDQFVVGAPGTVDELDTERTEDCFLDREVGIPGPDDRHSCHVVIVGRVFETPQSIAMDGS